MNLFLETVVESIFEMSIRGLTYFKKHFFFSNKLVQLFMGLRPYQSSNDQFLQIFTVIIYLLPLFVHQCYHLHKYTDTLHSTTKILRNLIAVMCFMCTYSTTYYRFLTIKLMYTYFKYSYAFISDEDELNIFEHYTKTIKIYMYCFVGIINVFIFVIIFPSILSIFIYYFGTLDNVHVILPLPINNISNPGLLFYSLFLYQTSGIYIIGNIASIWNALYLILIQNACCQFSAIGLKLQQPFMNNKNYNGKNWYDKNTWKELDWIIDIIKRCQRATELVDLISYFTKITYLLCSFLVMIIILMDFINIFQLASKSQMNEEVIESCIGIITSVFITYINFYVGQRLINHSNIAYNEICKVPFYMLSIKTQKLLLFIILKSRKECGLSIGGFFVASHEIFSGLIQKAFSFAMMYYSLY